jgi:tRNA-specific 2-thiouridylase
MFPLGDMVKTDVRDLAIAFDLPVAHKSESYEICFVPNGDYAAFIDGYLQEKGVSREAAEGAIVNESGKELGRHQGAHNFTVGQRKRLGVSAPEALYVISTDPKSQTVTVGSNNSLLRSTLIARDLNWLSWSGLAAPARARVRIRNRHMPAAATLYPLEDGRVQVHFDEPQRAVTPGQGAIFYCDDLVVGGGWIE